jgi:hypothetical protein
VQQPHRFQMFVPELLAAAPSFAATAEAETLFGLVPAPAPAPASACCAAAASSSSCSCRRVVAAHVEGGSLLIGRHVQHSAVSLAGRTFSQSDEEEVELVEYTTCSALPRALVRRVLRGQLCNQRLRRRRRRRRLDVAVHVEFGSTERFHSIGRTVSLDR